MKMLFMLTVVLLTTVGALYGQEYKKFRMGVGIGWAIAGGEGASAGMLWGIEPGYRLNDKIVTNLRIELSTMVRGTIDNNAVDYNVAGIHSFTLNSQFYFRTRGIRPFAGGGFGLYRLEAIHPEPMLGAGPQGASAVSRVGLYPRIGFDAAHFTLCIDYNLVPNTAVTIGLTSTETKNSYLGIRFGGYLGGGRKQPFKNALLH